MSVTEDLYGWVAHEHANVHARLVEWARWVRPGLPAAAACRSLEGRYRTPQVENGLAICDECGYTNRVTFTSDCARCGVALPPMPEVAAKPDPIDLGRALAVERVMIAVPAQHREHLKLWYVVRATKNETRKRIHLHRDLMQDHLWNARQMAKNLLLAQSARDVYTGDVRAFPVRASESMEAQVPPKFASLAS